MVFDKPLKTINKWLTNGLKEFVRIVSNEAVIVGKDWMEDRWNRIFGTKNMLILGPKGSGKTSLVLYLVNGHPYEHRGGKKIPPNPTATAAIVDKKFKLQHGNWQKIKKDVPGDRDLRSTWSKAIEEVNPRGIVYMLDGRKGDDELLEDTEEIQTHVLSNYENSLRNLETLHVFVNFADQWANSPEIVRTKKNIIRKVLEKYVLNDSKYQQIRTEVSQTQLSPDEHSWQETQRALYKFGADLGK